MNKLGELDKNMYISEKSRDYKKFKILDPTGCTTNDPIISLVINKIYVHIIKYIVNNNGRIEMKNNDLEENKINHMDEIKRIRQELEQMYLYEKNNLDSITDRTVKYSQELDVYIVEEQRRRFNAYKLSKQIS